MRFSVASAAFATAFVLAPAALGHAPASAQDFSITNPEEPADAWRRDMMRQLQAWWDVHAYYPRHASAHDEGGTVKVHLVIWNDGNIFSVNVVGSSGSPSLDAAAAAVFRAGFVRPLPESAPRRNELDISLHYVLAHRHDEPVAAGYAQVSARGPFTITNDPVKSPILETMLQRTCTGTIVQYGIRNHPIYGVRGYGAQLVFFRKPDGTPWVKLYEGGYIGIAPVVEVGKLVSFTGPIKLSRGSYTSVQYTVWLDGENKLDGNIKMNNTYVDALENPNTGGTLDFTCATEIVPQIQFNGWYVTPGESPPGDPP